MAQYRRIPFSILLWMVFFVQGVQAAGLPAPVSAALDKHKLAASGLSVYVHEIGAPRPLIAVADTVPRNPASTIKLVTSYAALEILGPGHTWETVAYLDGPLKDGRLQGNLVLRGGGDPYLLEEAFWKFLRDLRDRGLRHIAGDLVIDNGLFRPPAHDPGAFDGRPSRAYNVGPEALMVNFQATRFRVLADPDTARVRVVTEPRLANVTIDNQLRLVEGRCRRQHQNPSMEIRNRGRDSTVRFSGDFASGCGELSFVRVVTDPMPFVYGAFKELWHELGGSIDGDFRDGSTPPSAERFHTMESRPLSEAMRGVNKYSNNVMARQLLLTVGMARHGEPGTVDKGRAAVREWLQGKGLAMPELVLDNGSGLSRDARISAGSLGRLLLDAYASPYMPEFIASLPLSGIDGTLWRRFRNEALTGRAHLKTGSLNGSRAVAGYLQARSGRRYVVVSLHNDARLGGTGGRAVQDALLRWVYEH